MKLFFMSLQNLTRKRWRTLFTFLAIMLGTASNLAVLSTVSATKESVQSFIETSNEQSDIKIRGKEYTFADQLIKEVKNTGSVRNAIGKMYYSGNVDIDSIKPDIKVDDKQTQAKIQLTGLSNFNNEVVRFNRKKGSLNKSGLVIDERTSKMWGVQIGDKVPLTINKNTRSMPITAIVQEHDYVGSPETWGDAKYERFRVALPLSTLQEMTGLANQIRFIDIRTEKGEKEEAINQLEKLVKPYDDVYIDPMYINESELATGLSEIFLGLNMLGVLGILMSGMILFSTMYINVVERKKDFAIMKTLGYTSKQIRNMILTEVTILTTTSVLAGVIVGLGLSFGLIELMERILDDMDREIVLKFTVPVLISIISSVSVSMLSALLPIKAAEKVQVIHTLKNITVEKNNKHNPGLFILGIIVLAFGTMLSSYLKVIPIFIGVLLVFPLLQSLISYLVKPLLILVFKLEGRIAFQNVMREKNRTTITAAILAIGISFIVAISSINHSLQETIEKSSLHYLGGDMVVQLLRNVENKDLEKIKEIEGVKEIYPNKITGAFWNKRRLEIFSTPTDDSEQIPMFSSKTGIADVKSNLKEPNTIVLANNFFQQWGGEVGESITLDTPRGKSRFKVVGIVETIKENGNIGFVSFDHFKEELGVDFFLETVIMTDKNEAAEVKDRIAETFGNDLSSIETVTDYTERMKESYSESFTMMNILLILVVSVSGIGILNTLLMSITERKREIGMMRALALTRGQMAKIVLLEGLFISLIATMFGILLGILLSYSVMNTTSTIAGLDVEFMYSWIVLGMSALFGLLIGLLSSVFPASAASKLNVQESLRYE